ncbi:MAG: shikimate kinase [Candidatus Gastranaerophilales bacterium]|nr:shikimate kinase [Candidatus Gastranaerophilales bacterium]
MNISLIGMMGSGKTTIGKILAEKLDYIFTDTDSKIVEQENCSINEIFGNKGEDYFRKLETNVLIETLKNDNQIVSTGGGIIKKDENINLLKEKSIVFYLEADDKTLFERVKNNKERPLLNVENMQEKITILLNERIQKYKQAHHTISTINKTPNEIVNEIIGIINEYSRS